MEKDKNTEQKILEAAEAVFHEKDFAGARMQEIAEHAGINKGLLHYYFKTKDALFEAIFSVALNGIISKILVILEMDIPLEEKISHMVDQYMTMLLRTPGLPRFVLNELNKNPDRFVSRHLNKNAHTAFGNFVLSVNKEVGMGKIKPVDPRQLFTNLMSLLIFPFVGRPLLQSVFGADDAAFKQLLTERKTHIKEFIANALRN